MNIRSIPIALLPAVLLMMALVPGRTLPLGPTMRSFQDHVGILTIRQSAGNIVWPNDGNIPVIAFGWGGEAPQPVEVAVDSGFTPFFKPGVTATLTIQKHSDVFSSLLQQALLQHTPIESMTFSINSSRHPSVTYTLYDVSIASIRDVGQMVTEQAPTEEIVFAFNRMTVPGQ